MFTVISRIDALNEGRTRYYTGAPCRHGHDAERYVSTANCVECGKDAAKRFGQVTRRKMAENFDRRRHELLPANLHVHVDDHEAVYTLIDYLNQARGRPPCPRPEVKPVAPPDDTRTPWEKAYDLLLRVHRDPATARDLASIGNVETHSAEWLASNVATMPEAPRVPPPPVDYGRAKPDYLP